MLFDSVNPCVQTKTAKSIVGVSLSVDNSKSLTVVEYVNQRGSSCSFFSSFNS